jgi:hypothetical protein
MSRISFHPFFDFDASFFLHFFIPFLCVLKILTWFRLVHAAKVPVSESSHSTHIGRFSPPKTEQIKFKLEIPIVPSNSNFGSKSHSLPFLFRYHDKAGI